MLRSLPIYTAFMGFMTVSAVQLVQAEEVSETGHSTLRAYEKAQHAKIDEEYGSLQIETTLEQRWRVNRHRVGEYQAELESIVGKDDRQFRMKFEVEKPESEKTNLEMNLLYSQMLSAAWNADLGLRYRSESHELDEQKHRHHRYDAVVGLHGLIPKHIETRTYLYLGEQHYSAMHFELEREFQLNDKWMLKPYAQADIIFKDHAPSAKKTGLNEWHVGVESEYAIRRNVLPFLKLSYEYEKGKQATKWQAEEDANREWFYTAGLRFEF